MKKLFAIALMLTGTLAMVSCGDDDGGTDPIDPTTTLEGGLGVLVESNITSDRTWVSDSVYVLAGRIAVEDGATLTIEPGTIIKGKQGTAANATALLIARGAKINANGTADAPIIFTSISDKISPSDVAAGNFASPNLPPNLNGLWGGVLVLGKARISASVEDADASEVQIEGIPSSDTNGLYGGTEDDDNSGVLRYVSIRHGGANIGAGNEINGLTLGAVGSATVIEHIEIVANQDDGIEWFGGTVNTSNIVVWNTGDDGVDTDQSFSGTVDNFIVLAAGDEAMELDGPEGSASLKIGSHAFQNGTIVGSNEYQTSDGLIDLDANTGVSLTNIAFLDLVLGQDVDRVECGDIAGGCPFSELQFVLPSGVSLDDFFVYKDDDGNIVDPPVSAPAGASAVTTPTVGADATVFGWTWAANAGALDGL